MRKRFLSIPVRGALVAGVFAATLAGGMAQPVMAQKATAAVSAQTVTARVNLLSVPLLQ